MTSTTPALTNDVTANPAFKAFEADLAAQGMVLQAWGEAPNGFEIVSDEDLAHNHVIVVELVSGGIRTFYDGWTPDFEGDIEMIRKGRSPHFGTPGENESNVWSVAYRDETGATKSELLAFPRIVDFDEADAKAEERFGDVLWIMPSHEPDAALEAWLADAKAADEGAGAPDDAPISEENEDPAYPLSDWQYQVDNGDTRLGYADWVEGQREMNADGSDGEE